MQEFLNLAIIEPVLYRAFLAFYHRVEPTIRALTTDTVQYLFFLANMKSSLQPFIVRILSQYQSQNFLNNSKRI